MEKEKKKSVAYINPDAEMNYTNKSFPPPKTQYEKKRETFKKEKVKDLTKGKYGKQE